MQNFSILHHLSKWLIATYKFRNLFGISILTGFMTCISSHIGLQKAFLIRTLPPWGQCSSVVCQYLAKLRRRFVDELLEMLRWFGCKQPREIPCCSDQEFGQSACSCSHHGGLQRCSKRTELKLMLLFGQRSIFLWIKTSQFIGPSIETRAHQLMVSFLPNQSLF